MKGWFSIRTRVALLAAGLVLVVVTIIAGVAYREVRRTALDATRAHLASVAQQLGAALGTSAAQTEAQIGVAADNPAISAVLHGGDQAARAAANDVLRVLAAQSMARVVELWNASGTRLLTTNDSVAAGLDPSLPIASLNGARLRINEMTSTNGRAGYSVVARVGPGGSPAGYIVERRPMAAPAVRAQVKGLIGAGTSLYVGNASDAVWTDLVDTTDAPGVREPGNAEYERVGSGRVLAQIAPIPHTPWLVAVETPRQVSLAPARGLLWRMAWVTLVLVVAAMIGAWRMSAVLTRPVLVLASKADEVRSTLRETEAELADTESRYRMMFDASPHPMWVYDTETLGFLTVNDAAASRYGYSRAEFLTMSLLDVVPAEDLSAARAKLAELGSRGGVQAAVGRHRASDGSHIEVEVSSRALALDGKRARLVLVHDLTERRRAEESLRAAQDRLERLLGSAGAVLYESHLSPGGSVLDWVSGNITSILGYEPSEVTGDTGWLDNIHPDDRPAIADRLRPGAHRDGSSEYRFRRSDGSYRWLREEQRLLPGDAGESPRVVGVWLDITDHRELELQLRQSQKMEAIGRLAGGIAHDFNNLLTVILSESQFVLGDPEMAEPERRESLVQINKAGERAAQLTRQLLDFSRRSVIDATTLDLNVVVADIDGMIRRLIGEDVDLKLITNSEPVMATVDRGQLEQVFVNLVVNSRDAMPDGGLLTIETQIVELDDAHAALHSATASGPYAVLSVSDSGIGMSDEVKAHIFEPFFTTKEKGTGTGLGLATCYAIAKQFGGHIGVYSEHGIGTTIKLYLPLARSGASLTSASAPAAEHGSEIVLLVEDEEPVRRIAARGLRSLGYTVFEAVNGAGAIAMFAEHGGRIDLLVTDVVMPGIGGPAIAERLREMAPELAVLFISGYSDDVVFRNRLAGSDFVLLQKPFTVDGLARKVREAIARPAAL